jgi:hypothetical protein
MQPEKFRYTLLIDEQSYVLKNAPRGWEETFLNYKRSSNYWGLIRSFTVPLAFVLDGAYLLRREFYSKSIRAKTVLKIEVLNNADWTYKLVYEGEVDYTQFKDEDNSVSVNVTDVGVAENVASSDKAVFEIEINSDAGAVSVEIPSVSLIDTASLLVIPQSYTLPTEYRILPMDVIDNELINEKVETQIVDPAVVSTLTGSDKWALKANENTRVNLSGTIEAFATITQNGDRVFVEFRNGNNELKGTLVTYVAGIFNQPYSIQYSISLDLVTDEKIFLISRYTGTTPINFRGDLLVQFFNLKISNEILLPPSVCVAIPAFNLFEILLERMNGKKVVADSILLKTSNLFITCGDAIREFQNPVIKTSFLDFYKSIDAVLGCGFGLDFGVARLESKEFFFRNVEAVNLGGVKSFDLSVAEQFYFNTLKVGYKEEKFEENQGREEFNQGQVWVSPNKKTDTLLERVSIYRADQFGIALLRKLTISDNIQNVDSESDNDIWILQGSGIEEIFVQKLETGNDYNYISGISNEFNAININLSPKRCLLRSGSFLSIGLTGFESDLLKFGSAEKNSDLVAEKNGVLVSEKNDLAISVLKKKLFLPYLVKITVDMQKNSWSLIDANLFGFFTFSYNGAIFRGFIEEASNDIGSNTQREISLYLHPDTNLNNLIK